MLTPAYAAHAALWARLAALDLDGAASLPFSRRLARDNGWRPDFAARVVLEYRRFVFLAATCGHPVTPSDEVDQAWHLHLVYTRSYWDELCGQVLGFALHHGPTRGGAAEGHKFRDWYGQTLRAYRAAFGTLPPADIWPPAAVRFGEAPHFRRLNVRRYLLLPRPRWLRAPRWPSGRGGAGSAGGANRADGADGADASWLALGLLALGLVLVGCTTRLPLNPLDWYGAEFLTLFWALLLVLLPGAWWQQQQGGPTDDYHGPAPTPYQLARLRGPGDVLANSALAAMLQAGHLHLTPEGRVLPADEPPTDSYERAIWNMAAGGRSVPSLQKLAASPNLSALRELDADLEQKGLLLPAATRARLDRWPRYAATALVLLGGAKLLVGLSRERPVGYLFLSLLVVLGYSAFTHAHGAWASGRGRRLLRAARARQQRSSRPPGATYSAETVALTVALLGVSELSRLGLTDLRNRLVPPSSAGSSDGGSGGGGDGGGSDGGGGGDSGCGGCGGCGGGGD